MGLTCIATDLTDRKRDAIISILEEMGLKPEAYAGGVKVEYNGALDHNALSIVAVFEEFSEARTILFNS